MDQKIANADMALEDADDQLALARAREQLRSAQWLAERRDRARYGVQPVAHAGGDVQVVINLAPVQGITIDNQS